MKVAIAATHAAIRTLLAAEIGNFHHGANKNLVSKVLTRGHRCAFVESGLPRSVRREIQFGW
jgi:hypothetical protein